MGSKFPGDATVLRGLPEPKVIEMSTYLDAMANRAFKIVPGVEYNRTLDEMTRGGENPEKLVFYEVPLGEGKPWEYLRDKVYPMMARYLKAKKINPEEPDRVIVVVFHKDRCYLLTGKAFLDVFMEMEGLSPEAFHFRVLQWLTS